MWSVRAKRPNIANCKSAMTPRLTIITVNRNNQDGLQRTIESVVSQSWTEREFIVIDGASTDGSVGVIEEYQDRITYWVSERDEGIYDAMNKGADRATGEYIYFLNAGDTLLPHTLRTLFSAYESWKGCDVVYGDIQSGVTGQVERAYDIAALPLGMCFCHQAVIVRTALQKALRFNSTYRVAADYDMFFRAFMGGRSFARTGICFAAYDAAGVSHRGYLGTTREYARILWHNHTGWKKPAAVASYLWGRRKFVAYLLITSLVGKQGYVALRARFR
jgi:glycosyltransferase involved in cell wall biosynthesis